jgi:hypothetical protein
MSNSDSKNVMIYEAACVAVEALGWKVMMSNEDSFIVADEKGKFAPIHLNTTGELYAYVTGIHAILLHMDVSTFQGFKDKSDKYVKMITENSKQLADEKEKGDNTALMEEIEAKRTNRR